MSGYIELNRTGFAPFDDALSLIEEAGDAYYHTSQWIDDGWNGEKPYLVQINESIAFAAKSYLNLQEQIIELTRRRDNLLAKVDLSVEALRYGRLYAPDGSIALDNINAALSAIKESEEN